jgi:phospholipase/carboxylesterase
MNAMTDLGFRHKYVAPRAGSTKTLLLLHGTGGNEDDLIPLAAELLPDAGILSPRGKVLENGMPRFFRRLAMGVFDQEDLRIRTDELAKFIRDAAELYNFDVTQVIAVGYSNGANIAASLLFRHSRLLLGAALLHAMTPFVPEVLPDLQGKRIFLSAGENDPMVPRMEASQLADLITQSGADLDMNWFSGGHQLSAEEVRRVDEWFKGFGSGSV